MHLVDSSSWIEFLRERGKPEVKDRVAGLLKKGQASWCSIVRLELWNGASADQDIQLVLELETYVTTLEITEEVWNDAIFLSQKHRAAGRTFPLPDMVIAACARHHKVEIESLDAHFQQIAKLR